MRALWFGCLLGLGLAATAGEQAQAQYREPGLFPWQFSRNHPWCAFYNDGVTECFYYNVRQCRASISGVGGYCYQNPAYVVPPPTRRARTRYHRPRS